MKALLPIYVKVQTKLHSMLKNEEGATMVEYALMLALIAGACYVIVGQLGTTASATFGTIQGKVAVP